MCEAQAYICICTSANHPIRSLCGCLTPRASSLDQAIFLVTVGGDPICPQCEEIWLANQTADLLDPRSFGQRLQEFIQAGMLSVSEAETMLRTEFRNELAKLRP